MRLGLKTLIVALLALAILAALGMIRGTIGERQRYRNEAVASVARSFAGAQAITGPVLVVPYVENVEAQEKDAQGVLRTVRREEQREWVFFPTALSVGGRLLPSIRYRGLYEVRVYQLDGEIAARFDAAIPSDADGVRRIGRPRLAYGFGDVHGLVGAQRLRIDGRDVALSQGLDDGQGGGVHALLDTPAAGSRMTMGTDLGFGLRGSETLAIVPLADRNRIVIDSSWPHPQFDGDFLPLTRRVDDNGFHAEWDVSSLATNAQAQYRSGQRRIRVPSGDGAAAESDTGMDAIGISLVEPVNVYSQADRATKYGILFVVLTFVGFFMFELVKRIRVHPIQYLLVGLAIAIFFLLLVALSEHIAFGWAYLAASAACIGLLGFYLSFVLHSVARGTCFASVLATLYAALYGLLVSEDNALVLGAGLLFVILATIMIVTRKVDWYATSKQVQA